MKVSNYNYILQLNGKKILYNTFSQKSLVIPEQLIPAFQHDNKYVSGFTINILKDEAKKLLLDNGMIIYDDEDEYEQLLYFHNKAKFSADVGFFTVFTTHHCNFKCDYCSQQYMEINRTLHMTPQTAGRITSFIKATIKKNLVKKAYVSLYGGEPLLNPEICEQIFADMHNFRKEYKVELHFKITTNGYFLSDTKIESLFGYRPFIHIALDGNEENHNKHRMTKNNEPSFRKILSGIKKLLENHVQFGLRVHFNFIDRPELESLLNDLMNIGLKPESRAIIYFMHIKYFKTHDNFIRLHNEGNIEERYKYQKAVSELKTDLKQHILAPLFRWDDDEFDGTMPSNTKCLTCQSESRLSYTFSSDGNVYKCADVVGGFREKDYVIGRIDENAEFIPTSNYYRFLCNSVYKNAVCRECLYLPMCAGICLFRRKPESAKDCDQRFDFYNYCIEHNVKKFSERKQIEVIKV